MRPMLPTLLLSLIRLLAAAEPGQAPPLPPEDRAAVDALFARLREGFLAGNHRLFPALLTARDPAEEERWDEIVSAVRRELKTRSYAEFEVCEWSVEEMLGRGRIDLWVRLRTVCVLPDKVRVENHHNDFFLVERQAEGGFLLVDSPFFQTLGRQQGVGLIADALLAAIGCLVALTFWVWMGFEAFSLRPRRAVWRSAILLLPLLGAVAFFLFCFLPGLFRPRPAVEEKSRSGLTNRV